MSSAPLKRSWLFVLPLVAGLLWVAAGPTRAAGERWVVTSVDSVGCDSGDWSLTVVFSGVDGGTYVPHTTATSGGKVYMNDDSTYAPIDGAEDEWGLHTDSSYGPTTGT